MEEYILKYEKSNAINRDVHHSWYELCEKQTKAEVVKILKKHLYEPGEYTFYFRVFDVHIRRKRNQNFFKGELILKNDKVIGGLLPIGFIELDYIDDTFENYDFKNSCPEIYCEKELLNPTAQFVIARDSLFPSEKEFEIICEKSVERFIKRLHKSVSFPLEIACDYPDVVFEVCYDCKPDESLVADTLKVIEEWVVKYNKRHENGIHYVGEVSDVTDDNKSNAVYVHVDFGDCNVDVLAFVIKAIGKSGLPIKEMTLR